MEFCELPGDLIVHIIALGGPSVAAVMPQCNRNLQELCNTSDLWYQICRRAGIKEAMDLYSSEVDWKSALRDNLALGGRVFMASEELLQTDRMLEVTLKGHPIRADHYACGWSTDYFITRDHRMYMCPRYSDEASEVLNVGDYDVRCLKGNSDNFAWITRKDSLVHDRTSPGPVFDFPVKDIACCECATLCISMEGEIYGRVRMQSTLGPVQQVPNLAIRGKPDSIHGGQNYAVAVSSVGDMRLIRVDNGLQVARCILAQSMDDYPVRVACGVSWLIFVTRSGKMFHADEIYEMDSQEMVLVEVPNGPWVDVCFGNTYGVALHKNGSIIAMNADAPNETTLLDLNVLLPPGTVVKRVMSGYFHVVFLTK